MPRPKRTTLRLDDITDDDRFNHRSGRISQTHVDTLSRTLRGKRKLDPIWVWREVNTNGQATGALILMDGRHRLAAYKDCFIKSGKERYLSIPSHIYEGSEVTAALQALAQNSKDKLALSLTEKLDAAWMIVARDLANEATKPMVAAAAGISQRTVLNMRNKRNEIIKASEQLPDTWHKARIWPEESDWVRPTDAELEVQIEELKGAFQEAIRSTRSRDSDVIAEAFHRAVGEPNIRYVLDYLRGSDEDDYEEFADDAGYEIEQRQQALLGDDSDF
jgi:hypothetical protein